MWTFSYFVTQFARITDFIPLTVPGETKIQDTDYSFRVKGALISYIYLMNNSTRQEHEISASLFSEEYALFNYDGRPHFVLRSKGGGTNNAFDYVVVDISTSEPNLIGYGQACSNPRLNGDSLEFYDVPGKCDLFPFGSRISTWKMKLDVNNEFSNSS